MPLAGDGVGARAPGKGSPFKAALLEGKAVVTEGLSTLMELAGKETAPGISPQRTLQAPLLPLPPIHACC